MKDPTDIVVVTYTSMNTNSFEKYGECLMGSRGTLIAEIGTERLPVQGGRPDQEDGEGTAFHKRGRDHRRRRQAGDGIEFDVGRPGRGCGQGRGSATAVSRGYREEMEHFAFCVRELKGSDPYVKDADGNYALAKEKRLPKCHGEVAMADAILALSANLAMDRRTRISFEENWNWFDANNADTPEAKFGRKKA